MTAIEGVGPQHPKAADGTDPRGWLVFEFLPAELQRREDSRANLDREQFGHVWSPWLYDAPREGNVVHVILRSNCYRSVRFATATEAALLAHLGKTVPDDLRTVVDFSRGVRNRRWPELEGMEGHFDDNGNWRRPGD